MLYLAMVKEHILDLIFSAHASIFVIGIEFILANPHFLNNDAFEFFLINRIAFLMRLYRSATQHF